MRIPIRKPGKYANLPRDPHLMAEKLHEQIIAVDVVLIPPKEVVQLAVSINHGFPQTAAENYVLDGTTCIPHVTLLMGLISRSQLPRVEAMLSALARQFSVLNLQITSYHVSPRSDGKVMSSLIIERTPELQRLHEAVAEVMSPIFSYDGVRKEMFFSPPVVNEVPLFWVKGFAKTSIRERYEPHITLGFGQPQPMSFPVRFKASRLALCHLGNYCTCRQIFWSTELK